MPTFLLLREQESPVRFGGETFTKPAKLFTLVTLMVEVPVELAKTMAGTTFPAAIVMSPTCTIAEVEWEEAPGEPEPVIVTTYVPTIVGFNRQEPEAPPFADSLTGVLGHATVRPVFGLTDEASVMFPAKLKLLTRDTEAEVPETPRFTLTSGPAAEMVKSPTWTTEEAC